MNKALAFAAAFAAGAAVLLTSCSRQNVNSDASEKTRLLVSIEPQRYVLEQLVDSNYTVGTVLARGANPETFDPSTTERMAVENAAIYFTTGVLTFESTLVETSSTPTVNTSKNVELLFDTHGHLHHDGEHGHEADPHYWSSISGMRAVAKNMTDALVAAVPADSLIFKSRLLAYEHHLDSLDDALSTAVAAKKGTSFAVWHPSLSYFARDYDLHQVALGQEGKEMSAKGLREAIDLAKNNGVEVFFFQKEYDSRQAEAINEGIGSRIVEINPLAYNWEDQLILIADEIAGPQ